MQGFASADALVWAPAQAYDGRPQSRGQAKLPVARTAC